MNKILFRIIFFVFLAPGIEAYPQQFREQLRERIAIAKLNEIGRRLELNQTTLNALRPVYLRFEFEKAEINKNSKAINRENVRWSDEMPENQLTEEQAEKFYFAVLDRTRKNLDLQEKFYPEFRKVLSPKQIIRLYKIENEINRRIMQNVKKRLDQRK